jgi:hypothetical protein
MYVTFFTYIQLVSLSHVTRALMEKKSVDSLHCLSRFSGEVFSQKTDGAHPLTCWSVFLEEYGSSNCYIICLCPIYFRIFTVLKFPFLCLRGKQYNESTWFSINDSQTSFASYPRSSIWRVKFLFPNIFITKSGPGWRSRFSDLLRAGRSGDPILVGARFSAPVRTGPEAHPHPYTVGTGSFPELERPGHAVDHPPPSSTEVKERAELYL